MASNKRRVSSVDDNISEPPTKRRLISHDLPYPSTSTSVRPVPLQQPLPLLTFSYTPSRTLEFTDSALRYYVDPPGGAELRYGYERWVKRPEEKGRIDGLLKAVHRIRTRMDESGTDGSRWLRDIGVVSWRGVMTKENTDSTVRRSRWMGDECNGCWRYHVSGGIPI
ncbi:hypothetical protein AcV5_008336 [Taiwanofungus camphoratus]|nr:hypothetical protein AcV5_008336 [Antrodia cinnamomea]KAI0955754.1 hypothetical protein AcV7_006333 [Antrodia cinnamomea]